MKDDKIKSNIDINEQFKEIAINSSKWVSEINKQFTCIQNLIKEIVEINKPSEEFKDSIKNIAVAMKRISNNLKPMEEKLIKSGWTINMNMEPYHINEIAEDIPVEKIDQYFYEYYMENNHERFEFLKINTEYNLNINLIKSYEESIFAFENKKYIICINTLIPILEGMLSHYSENKENIRMIGVCKEQLSKCSINENSINHIKWNINLRFIEKLYEKKSFSDVEGQIINRHWLIHGRSSFDIKEIDCLRIFNAINTITDIIERDKRKNIS